MDRASDSGSECWGFESLRACHLEKLRKPSIFKAFGVFSFLIPFHIIVRFWAILDLSVVEKVVEIFIFHRWLW